MKTIILGNSSIRSGNRGCVALCYSSIYILDQTLGHGKYKLYLTDSGEKPGIYSIKINDEEIEYESIYIPNIFSLKGLVAGLLKFKDTMYSFCILKRANNIMDIGQGDSFSDIYSRERFQRIDLIHKYARLFKKKYYFLPQTIGPFKDKKIIERAKKSLRYADLVMARDKTSMLYVNSICPDQKNVDEYIDVAFFLPFNKMEFDNNYTHVGLNISGLLWNGGYTKNNQFGLKCNYQTTLKAIIDYFLSIPNVKLHLISHVVGQELSIENDYAISFDLWQEYNSERIILAPFFLTPIDAKSYIAGMDFFVGARMHATIAAFSSGVPVVPMAYSRKFNGLFIDTLSYPYTVDMKTLSDEDILKIITETFNNRVDIKKTIRERSKGTIEERKEKIFNTLKIILKNSSNHYD